MKRQAWNCGSWIFHFIYIILMTIHGLKMIHRTQVVKLLGSYGHVVYVPEVRNSL